MEPQHLCGEIALEFVRMNLFQGLSAGIPAFLAF
jgi:hypothetical protein